MENQTSEKNLRIFAALAFAAFGSFVGYKIINEPTAQEAEWEQRAEQKIRTNNAERLTNLVNQCGEKTYLRNAFSGDPRATLICQMKDGRELRVFRGGDGAELTVGGRSQPHMLLPENYTFPDP